MSKKQKETIPKDQILAYRDTPTIPQSSYRLNPTVSAPASRTNNQTVSGDQILAYRTPISTTEFNAHLASFRNSARQMNQALQGWTSPEDFAAFQKSYAEQAKWLANASQQLRAQNPYDLQLNQQLDATIDWVSGIGSDLQKLQQYYGNWTNKGDYDRDLRSYNLATMDVDKAKTEATQLQQQISQLKQGGLKNLRQIGELTKQLGQKNWDIAQATKSQSAIRQKKQYDSLDLEAAANEVTALRQQRAELEKQLKETQAIVQQKKPASSYAASSGVRIEEEKTAATLAASLKDLDQKIAAKEQEISAVKSYRDSQTFLKEQEANTKRLQELDIQEAAKNITEMRRELRQLEAKRQSLDERPANSYAAAHSGGSGQPTGSSYAAAHSLTAKEQGQYTVNQQIQQLQQKISAAEQEVRDAAVLQKVANMRRDSRYESWIQAGMKVKGDAVVIGYDPNKTPEEKGSVSTPLVDAMAGLAGKRSFTASFDEQSDLYSCMTAEEFETYCGLLGKGDTAGAKAYISYLEETLNARRATLAYENMAGVEKMLYWLPAGLESGTTGVLQWFSGEPQPVSTTQMVSGMVQQEASQASPLLGYAYGAGQSIANMAPSILVSTATGNPLAGVAFMGMNAGGNSYAEALRQGKTQTQALGYGVVSGLSEVGLSYLLTGIGKFSGTGNLTRRAMGKLDAIAGVGKRAAAKFGIAYAGELVEEELQLFLDPFYRKIFFNEDYDAPTASEIFETAFVTLLTTAAYEGKGTIKGELDAETYRKLYDNKLDYLTADILNIDPESDLAQQMQKRLDEGQSLTASQIRSLVHEYGDVVSKASRETLEAHKAYLVQQNAEAARQDFAPDLSKYKGRQQESVKRAMESGLLNNTRMTHTLVDLISKLEADKGVTFNWADNERLKESGFALEGKIVNGVKTADGIILNVDSAKALNTVAGHEITHVLEGTEFNEDFRRLMVQFAKARGEYDSRMADLKALYKEGTDLEAELVADIVDDYIFTDEAFVRLLQTGKRGLFQTVYDEIKYLRRMATAGSKEARTLIKAEKLFEKIYREASANKTVASVDGEVKYSLKDAKIPTKEDLEAKPPVKVVDVSVAQTKGSYRERRQQILEQSKYVISRPYFNQDTKTMIFLTEHSYTHAFSNLGDIQLNAAEHLPELIENAVLTHADDPTHGSDYADGVYTFFAAARADHVMPVKLKVKEYSYRGQLLPKNIRDYFDSNPQDYAAAYDTVVLEVEEIEKSPSGSVRDTMKDGIAPDPDELSTIKVPDLLRLVKGEYEKYIPKLFNKDTGESNVSDQSYSLSRTDEQYAPRQGFSIPGEAVKLRREAETADATQGDLDTVTPESTPVAEDTAQSAPDQPTQPQQPKAQPSQEQQTAARPDRNVKPQEAPDEEPSQDLQPQEQPDEHLTEEKKEPIEVGASVFALDRGNIGVVQGYNAEIGEYTVTFRNEKGQRSTRTLPANMVTEISTEQTAHAKSIEEQLTLRLRNSQQELEAIERHRQESWETKAAQIKAKEEKLADMKNQDTRAANSLKRSIESIKRRQADEDARYDKKLQEVQRRITSLKEELRRDYTQKNKLNAALERIDSRLAQDEEALKEHYDGLIAAAREAVADKGTIISKHALELYEESKNMQKGVRVSNGLSYLLDQIEKTPDGYRQLRTALLNVKNSPLETVDQRSPIEPVVRELMQWHYEDQAKSVYELETEYEEELRDLRSKGEEDRERARQRYNGTPRQVVQEQHRKLVSDVMGDTTHWKDKKWGLFYKTNTLLRNLMDVVRDDKGRPDHDRAQKIYELLQGNYNTHEAELKLESRRLKKTFEDMKINKWESVYIQMMGEYRYNPDTKLSPDTVKEYYQAHKKDIDLEKVNKAIVEARKLYDDLFLRVNMVLRKQGFKTMSYRQGYFPHFEKEKESRLAKILNWKSVDTEIPTSIAGMTENFTPERSWQGFNKTRKGDTTDYNFLKGLDTYIHGALDWIYHIEDLQIRRAFENEIRYRHSPEGIRQKVDEIRNNPALDADSAQQLIDNVFAEAKNPLNNFVTDLRNSTNNLAGKKDAADRKMEEDTRRRAYATMTNISSRVSANMVVGSLSSALTNLIPITQSWAQVSPASSLVAAVNMIRNAYREDGMIEKSAFMTNRLIQEQNLNNTGWDKIGNVAGAAMNFFDHISTEIVWRSKFQENMKKGMTEDEAIRDADQFAENVMAGRSRGNMPTIFNAKNMATKMFTAFQLEVANQYGYMFKDLPREVGREHKAKLAWGYGKMFVGAYLFNSLLQTITGRAAAFDPIRLLTAFLGDLGFGPEDEDEDDGLKKATMNLAENVMKEMPFIGGLMGGGRIPISSALPYGDQGGVLEAIEAIYDDVSGMITDGDGKYANRFIKQMSNPLLYLLMPMGGGQIKKTIEGASMYLADHPVDGSYTNSGDLRYPVDDDPWSVVQALLFGQYANKNAREYFDKGYKPMGASAIKEYKDLGLPVETYRAYKAGLAAAGETTDDQGREKYIDVYANESYYSENNEYWYDHDTGKVYDSGGDVAQVSIHNLRKASALAQQVEFISQLPLSDFQKDVLYRSLVDSKQTNEYGYTRYFGTETVNGRQHRTTYYYDGRNGILYDEGYNRVDYSLMKDLELAPKPSMSDYDQYSGYDEFKFAQDNPYKYEFLQNYGVTWKKYQGYGVIGEQRDKIKEIYDWAWNNPKQEAMSKVIAGDIPAYKSIHDDLAALHSTRDADGKVTVERKEKVQAYIADIDLPEIQKKVLYKLEYPSWDEDNWEIAEYIVALPDASTQEKKDILIALGFKVDANGKITWD